MNATAIVVYHSHLRMVCYHRATCECDGHTHHRPSHSHRDGCPTLTALFCLLSVATDHSELLLSPCLSPYSTRLVSYCSEDGRRARCAARTAAWQTSSDGGQQTAERGQARAKASSQQSARYSYTQSRHTCHFTSERLSSTFHFACSIEEAQSRCNSRHFGRSACCCGLTVG